VTRMAGPRCGAMPCRSWWRCRTHTGHSTRQRSLARSTSTSTLKDHARVCYPIEDFHYGMREFAIFDNNGYLLQFGQPLLADEETSP
jgi:hypothetical protein